MRHTGKERQLILGWLEPQFEPKSTDPGVLHLERSKLQEPNTCDWMTTQCPLWQDWLDGGSSYSGGGRRFLWIHGLPGAGKTILASFLIDRVAEHCGAMGNSYYYCIHERNHDETESFLRYVIRDLCFQLKWIPAQLQSMWQYRQMPPEKLKHCLLLVTLQFKERFSKRTYIIVDAVDESIKPRKTFLRLLASIGSDPAFDHVSLLMTSRDEPDIREAIEALPRVSVPPATKPFATLPVRPLRAPRPMSLEPSSQQVTPPRNLDVNVPGLATPSRASSAGVGILPRQRPHLNGFAGIPIPDLRPHSVRYSTAPASPAFGDSDYYNSEGSMDLEFGPSRVMASGGEGYKSPSPSPTKAGAQNKRNLSSGEQQRVTASSQQRRRISSGGRHVALRGDGEETDRVSPCSQLSMDNIFVRKAIEVVIDKRLRESEQFGQWPRADFIIKLKQRLSARAAGVFRAVACYLDLIDRQQSIDSDDDKILAAVDHMPTTTFNQYEQILMTRMPNSDELSSHSRDFAQTALALICSDTAEIPDANVLVEASRFNIPQFRAQAYNLVKLKHLLGCLVREEPLRRKRPSKFVRNEADQTKPGDSLRLAVAHYTVKEFLYNKKTTEGPAKDFALSNESTRKLELKIAFYGLRQFVRKQIPTRYEEYCLEMTERALKKRPALIARHKEIWEAVHPCLGWDDVHQTILNKNNRTRRLFPTWAKLSNAFVPGSAPQHRHTCVVVSLLLLDWPRLADVYLRQALSAEQRDEIWNDRFALNQRESSGREKAWDGAASILEMCVLGRRIDFLDVFAAAGATFEAAGDIIYQVFEDPYAATNGDEDNDDGTTTLTLLRTLLQRGADPNCEAAEGCAWTPLQVATRNLEPEWVGQLLLHGARPNAAGTPPPPAGEQRCWWHQTPIQICRDTKPKWAEDDESTVWERDRVRQLLTNALIRDGIDPRRAAEEGPALPVRSREVVDLTE